MTNQNIKQNVARSLDDISLTELENKITILKSSDFRGLSIDQVREMIAEIIDQYPLQVRPLRLSGVYRARKRMFSEPFTHTKELWHPPFSAIQKPGRLNDKGESRFYAADTSNTAMLELRPAVGDIITVLLAHTQNEPSVLLKKVVFIGIERSRSSAIQNLTDEDIFRKSRLFRESLGEDNYKKWLIIDNYLSNILGKAILDSEEHMYKPTIALANLLFSNPNLDAVNYPSVETKDNGINICMTPEKADFYFRPSEAWMVRIDGEDSHPVTNEKLPRFKFLRRSRHIPTEGNIEWMQEGEELTPEAIGRFMGSTKVENLSEFPKPYS